MAGVRWPTKTRLVPAGTGSVKRRRCSANTHAKSRPCVVVGQQAVRHLDPLRFEGELGGVTRPVHRPCSDRVLDGNAEGVQRLPDPACLLPAFRREVALAITVADPVRAITGHPSRVGVAKEQDEATASEALGQCFALCIDRSYSTYPAPACGGWQREQGHDRQHPESRGQVIGAVQTQASAPCCFPLLRCLFGSGTSPAYELRAGNMVPNRPGPLHCTPQPERAHQRRSSWCKVHDHSDQSCLGRSWLPLQVPSPLSGFEVMAHAG